MYLFENIPPELCQYNQWIVWKAEDQTKIPYAINGNLASVSDPSTWTDFNSAVVAYNSSNYYSGIGFVFTANDPFSGIDLDNKSNDLETQQRHELIYKELSSYSELSPSGKGLHIIVKGKVEHGRRRQGIEIYSSSRFFTMTGNRINGAVIEDRNDKLNIIWQQLSKPTSNSTAIDMPQTQSDDEIAQAVLSAANGEKAGKLIAGEWQELGYPSQSEADFALMDIIAFYTQNKDQCKRLFRTSMLGQRKKANRNDYLEYMVNRAFDRQLAPIDIDLNRDKITAFLEQETQQKLNSYLPTKPQQALAIVNSAHFEPQLLDNDPYTLPPGLLGEIASFIYSMSPKPVKEISLAAAIGMMAGICGRAYNVSSTGLNLYIMLLAETGRGKEAMAAGIDRIMNAVVASGVPAATTFRGPADIMSGQALHRYLADNPCCVSVIGEFGYRLQAMAQSAGNSADSSFKRMLLDLYNKSGSNQVSHKNIYAKKENDTNAITSPAFSLLSESTPSTFFAALDDRLIEDGLAPRFIMIDYTGIRVETNYQATNVEPPKHLIDAVATLCEINLKAMKGANGQRSTVNVAVDSEAVSILQQFDKECDYAINTGNSQIKLHLWNRAYINTMKLAGLVAIGINQYNPIITVDCVMWAKRIVVHAINKILARFEMGLAGSNAEANEQFIRVNNAMREFISGGLQLARKYGVSSDFVEHNFIPLAYLQKRASKLSCFKRNNSTPSQALKIVLDTMVRMDTIRKVPTNQVQIACHGSKAECYVIEDKTLLQGNEL